MPSPTIWLVASWVYASAMLVLALLLFVVEPALRRRLGA